MEQQLDKDMLEKSMRQFKMLRSQRSMNYLKKGCDESLFQRTNNSTTQFPSASTEITKNNLAQTKQDSTRTIVFKHSRNHRLAQQSPDTLFNI